MIKNQLRLCRAALAGSSLLFSCAALANPVYQPPGANLTLGDVTHGKRAQSASTNPAAAAADAARGEGKISRGSVLSISAGLEYGNIQELFDLYNEVTGSYRPSNPGTPVPPDIPGQLPEDKEWGKVLGEIWDNLDPDTQAAVEVIAREVVTQVSLLALIAAEGHAKAWVAADTAFVFENEYMGGTWSLGLNWSGSSKAFGLAQPIEFDRDAARQALEDWLTMLPINRPRQFALSNDILLDVDPTTNAVVLGIDNDSSFLAKSTQTTELNVGYSRQAWSSTAGNLYLGVEARLYFMQLSRISVRFGDITDSEELFDSIRDSNFRSDEGLGMDVGALWVSENYQLGVQLTNINEPRFEFPDVNLDTYTSTTAINFLRRDREYTMDRQVKFEASVFSDDRRWSAHLGYDGDSATDPVGDDYQWLTVSAGLTTDSWWIPNVRIGYRENLAGTRLKYIGVGVTAFKYVNFDISSAFDTVQINGNKLPQGLMGSIGFEFTW